MADDLTDDQIGELKEAFRIFDKTRSGSITKKELSIIMKSWGLNPSSHDVQDIMNDIDDSGDGEFDFPEFIEIMSARMKNADTEKELRDTFRVMDKEGEGFITAAALKFVVTKLGEKISDEEVYEMMREADVDGDGQISFDEFRNIMTAN